jgi:hypothetical protein
MGVVSLPVMYLSIAGPPSPLQNDPAKDFKFFEHLLA